MSVRSKRGATSVSPSRPEWEALVDRVRGGQPVDASGLRISSARLRAMIRAAPTDEDGRPRLPRIDFSKSVFGKGVRLNNLLFDGDVDFTGTIFSGFVSFEDTTFTGVCDFERARFKEDASFEHVVFLSKAKFDVHVVFEGDALFAGARFDENAFFPGAEFEGRARFGLTEFQGDAWFTRAGFHSPADFQAARFLRKAFFQEVTFKGDAAFRHARFGGPAYFGEVRRLEASDAEQTVFKAEASFSRAVFASEAWFDGVTFDDIAWFGWTWFRDDVTFARASCSGETDFGGAIFAGRASFEDCQFGLRARFSRFQPRGRRTTIEYAHAVSPPKDVKVPRIDDEDRGSAFEKPANFVRAHFKNHAVFCGALFGDHANFARAQFAGETSFGGDAYGHVPGSFFASSVLFSGATFRGRASFTGRWASAQFRGDAIFGGREVRTGERDPELLPPATFDDDVDFRSVTVEGSAWFDGSVFRGGGDFRGFEVRKEVSFDGATFEGRASFVMLAEQRASFEGAEFQREARLGPILTFGDISLDRSSFHEMSEIEVSSHRLTFVGARFRSGVTLRVRWAEVALDEADFGAPSLFTMADEVELADDKSTADEALAICWTDRHLEATPVPRIVSLRRANVTDLEIAATDLRACRFYGAHNLDHLRIEGTCWLASAPETWRYSRRTTVAEEHDWRARDQKTRRPVEVGEPDQFDPDRAGLAFSEMGGSSGDESGLVRRPEWLSPELRYPAWLADVRRAERLRPSQLQTLYRALRKGKEDKGDEPGAADFYYGEMEMRRHDPDRPWAERTILSLYWVVSGYGLRGLRALGWLLVTVLVFALLLWSFGFEPRPPFVRSLLFSLESTSSLFRTPDLKDMSLTYGGEALQVVLRLLGPLFFGLALLALRGRIRR